MATGAAPPAGPPLGVDHDAVARDENGNAIGGVRTPPVDAPVATLTGEEQAVDQPS